MNTIINVECNDQDLIIANAPIIASGGVDENIVCFKFCGNWDGFDKTAVFYQNEKKVYYALLDKENKCVVPHEVTQSHGTMYIGVFGVKGEVRRTSKVERIRITKGAWSSDMHPSDPTPDIYTQIVSRYNDYDTRLEYFEERFNGSVGDAEKLGGETSDEWQTKLDSIQTTSSGTMLQVGWYRVAEYKGADNNALLGSRSNSCEIIIKRGYGTNPNEEHKLLLNSIYNKQTFDVVKCYSYSDAYHYITKVRYTKDTSTVKAYIEIYYNANTANDVFAIINDGADFARTWQAITPTLTSETVDGVTVATTYDIPANASPVTDLDLVRFEGTEVLTTDILEKALTVGSGRYYYTMGGSSYPTGTGLPNENYRYSTGVEIIARANGSRTVIIVGEDALPPIYNQYEPNKKSWSGWNTFATTDDLAKLTTLVKVKLNDGNQDNDCNVLAIGTMAYVYNTSANTPFNANSSIVFTYGMQEGYKAQIAVNTVTKKLRTRSCVANTWSEWSNDFATTADLVNYLPKTGGDINGNVKIASTEAVTRYIQLSNALRSIGLVVTSDGTLYLNDATNGDKRIITSTPSGANTFNGTASGNLALNGGGEVSSDDSVALSIKNTSNNISYLRFNGKDGYMGYLGFHGANNPIFRSSDGTNQTLLHKGNSAPTVVSTSAPSDTSAVWVVPSS